MMEWGTAMKRFVRVAAIVALGAAWVAVATTHPSFFAVVLNDIKTTMGVVFSWL